MGTHMQSEENEECILECEGSGEQKQGHITKTIHLPDGGVCFYFTTTAGVSPEGLTQSDLHVARAVELGLRFCGQESSLGAHLTAC